MYTVFLPYPYPYYVGSSITPNPYDAFHTYQEELQRAYQARLDAYEAQRKAYLSNPNQNETEMASPSLTVDDEEVREKPLEDAQSSTQDTRVVLKDYGAAPFVVNIENATEQNTNYRTVLWTGNHLQVTLMRISVGEDIGLERHSNLDQFIRIEEGRGLVQMGDHQHVFNFEERVREDDAIMIPAGKWHNLTNIGNEPLQLYSIYAPPEHPHGAVHATKAIALAAEAEHGHS
ncbi:cupin domain-containing protein [Oceanobacillus polygoni]|uniref:Mannose-6-phosphate isomerase-like protein (Cupin superfamily) n=1 Tax=Oceanobacillus polygoni TaxID=1235259 RepID=A0A9X0YZ76_9BACI|nr:cupin domain-containing protein [Oceanobacillus polygoni]MBP2079111.1 mannose-6-phosphate isomerase-like protein (cupin superfamily) [Oceanobacillus polygoni]